MDAERSFKLNALLARVEASPDERARFLARPVEMLTEDLQLKESTKDVDLSLANQLLIATLRNPDAIKALSESSKRHQAGEIDASMMRSDIAKTLIQHSPPEISEQLAKRWGVNDLPNFQLDPHAMGMANVAVAVDTVVVVTEAAVVNSEYVFSGRDRLSHDQIQRMSNILGGGN